MPEATHPACDKHLHAGFANNHQHERSAHHHDHEARSLSGSNTGNEVAIGRGAKAAASTGVGSSFTDTGELGNLSATA